MSAAHLVAWLQRWTSRDADEAIPTVSRDEAAVLVATVQNIQARDAARAAISCPDAPRHVDLWRQVARLVDGRAALPVLCLLGMASWIAGDGALANLVLDPAECTQGSAAYSLFQLLEEVLQLGIDPRTWDSLREAIVAQIAPDRCGRATGSLAGSSEAQDECAEQS